MKTPDTIESQCPSCEHRSHFPRSKILQPFGKLYGTFVLLDCPECGLRWVTGSCQQVLDEKLQPVEW